MTEGQETEPRYFRALFAELRLPHVIVGGDVCGTAPVSVVDYAATHRDDDDYAAVWCVFDCDEHLGVPGARQRADDCKMGVAFSNPCIEIWFLLHFRHNTRELTRKQAERECRKWIPQYRKSMAVYDLLRGKQEDAIAYARKLREEHHGVVNEGQPKNPYTSVDIMVTELKELAGR